MKIAVLIALSFCTGLYLWINRESSKPPALPRAVETAGPAKPDARILIQDADKTDFSGTALSDETWKLKQLSPDQLTVGKNVPGLTQENDPNKRWIAPIIPVEDIEGLTAPDVKVEAPGQSLTLDLDSGGP